MFGNLLDLTMTPATRTTSTIGRHIHHYVLPDNSSNIYSFFSPPREMREFDIDSSICRPLLVVGRQMTMEPKLYNHYLYGYIGNLLYCFIFTVDCSCDNMIPAGHIRGNLHIQVEEITPSMPLPPDGVNKWVQF